MKKSSMGLLLAAVVFVSMFSMIRLVSATIETRYMRDNFTLSASQGSTANSSIALVEGDKIGMKVAIVDSSGSETVFSGDNPVAQVTIPAVTVTLNVTYTPVAVGLYSTDKIRIKLYQYQTGSWIPLKKIGWIDDIMFTTDALETLMLNSYQWRIFYAFQYISLTDETFFKYGSSTWNSRIENFTYGESEATLDEAIDLAESYIDRAYYEVNSSHAVCKDYASLPIRIYDQTANHWIPLSKESLDKSMYLGGVKIEEIKTGHAFVSGDCNERWYRCDTDNDHDYDDLVLWCEDTSSNTTHIWYHIAVKNSPAHTYDVYMEDTKIIDDAVLDEGYTAFKEGGFFSQRYVLRHATRMMQYYYEDRGDTTKATKLNNTMNGIGFTEEFYAPCWNKSNSYTDDPYIDGKMYPDWNSTIKNNLIYAQRAIPFSSHLSSDTVFEGWKEYIRWFGNPLMDCIYALHGLNKYPADQNKIAEAKGRIDAVPWDGYGVKASGTAAYTSYMTAMYAMACARYYEVTENQAYADKSREALGCLIQTQLTLGKKIYCDSHGDYYDAGSVGGFLISYTHDKTFYYKGQSSHWLVSWGLGAWGAMGWTTHDPDEYQCIILANTETALLGWKALSVAKEMGLSPIYRLNIEDDRPLSMSWAVNKSDSSQISKAFANGYVEMYAGFDSARWATATLSYEFVPANSSIKVDFAFYCLGHIKLSCPDYYRFARLRLYAWIKDVTNNNQEVWSSGGQQLYYDEGAGVQKDYYVRDTWNITWSPNYSFNTAHTYQIFVKFDLDVGNAGLASEFDLTSGSMYEGQPCRIKVEELNIRD